MKYILAVLVLFSTVYFSTEQSIENRLKFILYSKNPIAEKSYNVSNFQEIVSDPKFDATKPTVFFFYGFTQSVKSSHVVKVKDAYLQNGGYNFIIVSIGVIFYNVINAKAISDGTIKSINSLVSSGYDLSKVEIVGFSLGVQIGALTARNIPNFNRLTGLDPGQLPSVPLIDMAIETPISSNDANFVLTIHTEKLGFGDEDSKGHVNVVFNNYRQPMCLGPLKILSNPVCNHESALTFWAEAVSTNSATVFPARKCSSYSKFESNECANEPVGYINPKTNATQGNYFLNTFKASPYSKPTAVP